MRLCRAGSSFGARSGPTGASYGKWTTLGRFDDTGGKNIKNTPYPILLVRPQSQVKTYFEGMKATVILKGRFRDCAIEGILPGNNSNVRFDQVFHSHHLRCV